jgi:hypothetical protein
LGKSFLGDIQKNTGLVPCGQMVETPSAKKICPNIPLEVKKLLRAIGLLILLF